MNGKKKSIAYVNSRKRLPESRRLPYQAPLRVISRSKELSLFNLDGDQGWRFETVNREFDALHIVV